MKFMKFNFLYNDFILIKWRKRPKSSHYGLSILGYTRVTKVKTKSRN